MFKVTDDSKSTEEIAQQLLGHLLVRETDFGKMSGWIVETEAYLGYEDAAAHSYLGKRTPRLHSMYQEAGTIYVYQMHTHKMLNIVTQPKGVAHAVLIRAIEPNEGEELMQLNRMKNGVDLTNGPGKLTRALNITMEDNGLSILEKPLYLDLSKKLEPVNIDSSPRIGIPNKGEWTEAKLRYTVTGNPYISRNRGKVSMDNGWKSMLE